MAPVTNLHDGAGDFTARVEAAQKAMADGIAKGGLQHDPYRHPLEALGMTVGLFPDLVRRLERSQQPLDPEDLSKAVTHGVRDCALEAVRALNLRNALIGAALLTVAVLSGSVGGYLFRGALPVLAGVQAGAQQCQDQPNGGRMCWIPVWQRLPAQ